MLCSGGTIDTRLCSGSAACGVECDSGENTVCVYSAEFTKYNVGAGRTAISTVFGRDAMTGNNLWDTTSGSV